MPPSSLLIPVLPRLRTVCAQVQQAQFESYSTGAYPVARGQTWTFRGKTYSPEGVADVKGFRRGVMSRAKKRIMAAAPDGTRPGEINPTHVENRKKKGR